MVQTSRGLPELRWKARQKTNLTGFYEAMPKSRNYSLPARPRLRYAGYLFVLLAPLTGCLAPPVDPFSVDSRELVLEEDEKELWDTAEYIERKIGEHTTSFEGQAGVERYLNEIVVRLAPVFLQGQEDRIRTNVVINNTPNAFVLPNGTTYVTSGLLVALENEAQLATILGHEISHYIHRHGLEQHRVEEDARRGGILFGIFIAGVAGAATGTNADVNLSSSAADLWTQASVSGYSRDLEREADRSGLIAMLKAGFQPKEAIRGFEILLAASDDPEEEQYSFFASHPRLTERIASYQEYLTLPEIKQYVVGEELGEERFARAISPVLLEDARLQIENGDTKTALLLIQRYRHLHTEEPRAMFLLAEAFQRDSTRAGDEAMITAVTHYREVLVLDPRCADCYKELGLLYRSMNQMTAAREVFLKYLELVPDAPDASIIRSFLK